MRNLPPRRTAMPRARLGAGSWQFEGDKLARLREKIVKGKKTLGEVYGAPLYGIKTGFNDGIHHRPGNARPAGQARQEIGKAAQAIPARREHQALAR